MLGLTELVVIGLVLGIPALLATLAHGLAQRKGRDPWRWAILTFFVPLALIVLLLLPDAPRRPKPAWA